MYRMILIVYEMLKILRAKVEARFFQKHAFVFVMFGTKMTSKNVHGQQKTF